MVINEYSISPAEDYFNGFVLGVNKECYLHLFNFAELSPTLD